MLALRTSEIRDKYTGEVIGEVQVDTRRDLRAKVHRAFQAKGATRRTSFEERAELGRRIAMRLTERRAELEELMVREGGQPRKFARWAGNGGRWRARKAIASPNVRSSRQRSISSPP